MNGGNEMKNKNTNKIDGYNLYSNDKKTIKIFITI